MPLVSEKHTCRAYGLMHQGFYGNDFSMGISSRIYKEMSTHYTWSWLTVYNHIKQILGFRYENTY